MLVSARHQEKPAFFNTFDHEEIIQLESDAIFDQKLYRKIMKSHCK